MAKLHKKIIKLFKVNLSYNCKILLKLYFSIYSYIHINNIN